MISSELKIEDVHNRLVEGILGFFNANGRSKAVIGLSGGIDSAVVAVLAVKALGKENVHALLMPSEFSTLHSIQDAVDMADNLDIEYHIIPISTIFKKFMKELQPIFGRDNQWNVAEEHLQTRIRGTLLMAYANKFNALLLNTTNKSELSVGYGTLYGDLSGALMVLGDLYKSEVYEMADYINSISPLIPKSTMTKAPSDELRYEQKDNDFLPDYSYLDPLLHALNEEEKGFEELAVAGYDRELLTKITSLRERSKIKLLQAPPLLNISSKPLVHESKYLL
ncbi:MAG: NAD(+) synthase [Bacteroidales bacterium]|nr:NAD(+) synthase [Bacteroidales bacterium]